MRQKDPHERRQAAMRIAGTLTAVVFVGWVATLGTRLGAPVANTAQDIGTFRAQVASVISGFSLGAKGPNTLEVASTTKY